MPCGSGGLLLVHRWKEFHMRFWVSQLRKLITSRSAALLLLSHRSSAAICTVFLVSYADEVGTARSDASSGSDGQGSKVPCILLNNKEGWARWF